MTYNSNFESAIVGPVPMVEANLDAHAAMVHEITAAETQYVSPSAMLGGEAVTAASSTSESRLGRMMSTIGESKAGRRAAAFTFLAASMGGGVASQEASAAAYVEDGRSVAPATSSRFSEDCASEAAATAQPVTMQPNAAGEFLPVTPVADCYGIYSGVKDLTVSPMENDELDPNIPIEEILKTEICAISPSDGMVILENYPPYFVDITVTTGATEGIHHNTVTICNREKGTSATFDLSVNVTTVKAAVIKKLSIIRRGYHVVKVTNNNDTNMTFNPGNVNVKNIPPHSSRRALTARVARWGAYLPIQDAPAGKGKIVFKR